MPQPTLYLQYHISLPDADTGDILIARLSESGMEGFEEQDQMLIGSGPAAGIDREEVARLLNSLGLTFTVQELANQNWNALWESSFDPVQVEDFVAIRAAFHPPVAGVAHELVITPKMSFGTGHHATTWLMVQAMQGLNFAGKKVLDFGTGTGVLAILAEKLGAPDILAIDIDEWSIDNAAENAAVNQATRIRLLLANAIPAQEADFDLLLANINRHIIEANMDAMYRATAAGGYCLLSGLLAEDEGVVTGKAMAAGFTPQETRERKGWISVLLKK